MDFQTNGTAEGTILYTYSPNAGAALTFVAAFGLATISHCIASIWLRTAYFLPFLIGCIMDTFGYYGRYWNSQQRHNFGAYCLQAFMLILAPIFYSATIYMSLRRIGIILEQMKITKRTGRWFSTLFVLGDVICLLVQVAGLGLQATTSSSTRQTGRIVTLIGLITQCLLTLGFALFTWRFICRARLESEDSRLPWKRYSFVLMGCAGLLELRNIVRVAEYAEGPTGFVAGHEVFVYLFDAAPMISLVVLMLIWQPGQLRRTAIKTGAIASSSEKPQKRETTATAP